MSAPVDRGLMAPLLPPAVAVAELVGTGPVRGMLLPEEEAALGRVVPSRHAEHLAGRLCARRAMAALRLPGVAVVVGADRAPVWPAGLVGAITHCEGYAAAAVARAGTVVSVGIDAEPCDGLPPGVLGLVADEVERAHLAGLPAGLPWDRLLFSAKEAVYKAWYPITRTFVGFEAARLCFRPGPDLFTGRFHATVAAPSGDPARPSRPLEFAGRYAVRDALLLTAVVRVPA